MKILNFCAGYDTGGYSIRLKQAFDRHSIHPYRSCIGKPVSYIGYPTDARYREARKLQAWADVMHVSHQPIQGFTKPQIVQYHGTKFRNNPGKFLELQRKLGIHAVCSTLDLWLIEPEMMDWLPSPYDLDWLLRFSAHHSGGPVRVGHAPTSRAIKSTDALIDACRELGDEVELVLIEKMPWGQCLKMKGTVDVYFDQVILGYGNNAVEAWGMGIPVIAGAQEDTLLEMKRRFDVLPFYQATEDTIVEALTAMLEPATRAEWSFVGKAHVERFHADHKVVGLLETIYESVM